MLLQTGTGLRQAQKCRLTASQHQGKQCGSAHTSWYGAASGSEKHSGAKPEHPGRLPRPFCHWVNYDTSGVGRSTAYSGVQ